MRHPTYDVCRGSGLPDVDDPSQADRGRRSEIIFTSVWRKVSKAVKIGIIVVAATGGRTKSASGAL